jgi:hypothetical protein
VSVCALVKYPVATVVKNTRGVVVCMNYLSTWIFRHTFSPEKCCQKVYTILQSYGIILCRDREIICHELHNTTKGLFSLYQSGYDVKPIYVSGLIANEKVCTCYTLVSWGFRSGGMAPHMFTSTLSGGEMASGLNHVSPGRESLVAKGCEMWYAVEPASSEWWRENLQLTAAELLSSSPYHSHCSDWAVIYVVGHIPVHSAD